MAVPTELLLLQAPAIAVGLWLAWRERQAPWLRRIGVLLLPPLLGALLLVYGETLALNTRWIWSACRLAPAIGLFHGYPLYSPVDHGPINGWLYGPVAALAWSPAALATTPLAALFIAAGINLLFLLVPLFVAAAGPGFRPTLSGGLAFSFGAAGLLLVYPTWYMASALNADAIAVGLGASSCLVLLRGALTPRSLWLAALLAGLAAWTKQTEAILMLAQVGWLWFAQGRRAALRYAGSCATVCLGLTLFAGLFFRPADLIFNMWTVPSGHAYPGGTAAAWVELTDFVRYTAWLWVPSCLVQFGRKSPTGTKTLRPGLLLVVALAVLPLGILATIKIGGDRNSMHSVYYLAVAIVIALTSAWPAEDRPQPMIAGVVLLAATSAVVLAVRQVAGYPAQTALPPRCLSQEAWSYARAHPGSAYFPWDPLATLLAEGRMYHFEYGVLDRIYAGRAPTTDRLRADLPTNPEAVIYPRANYSREMLKHLPGFTREQTTADWVILRRGSSAQPLTATTP